MDFEDFFGSFEGGEPEVVEEEPQEEKTEEKKKTDKQTTLFSF